MDRFKNKYRISSARLKNYDYGSHGLYFVTIRTRNGIHYLGDIAETDNYPSLQLTSIGNIANDYWEQIPNHFPFIELDTFVIMPNHLHGILFLNVPDKTDWNPNKFGPQSKNLGSVIRGFKSSVKRYAILNSLNFEWQSRYHDRIIRDALELNNIRKYIMNNPNKWIEQDRGA